MARTEKRLSDLERKTGGGGGPIIVVIWTEDGQPDPEQLVNVNGQRMTYAEAIKKYPNQKTITIGWDDDQD